MNPHIRRSPTNSKQALILSQSKHLTKKVSMEKVKGARDMLRGARVVLRMTQDDMAKATGLTHTTIVNFESGKTHSEATRAAIQAALEARGIVFTNGDRPGFYLDRDRAIIPT